MKIYLAAQYHRKDEIAIYAQMLREAGLEVVSTWTDEKYSPTVQLSEVTDGDLREIAERDFNEVLRSDVVILFTVSDQEWTRRNGRMVEFGVGLARDKRMIACGPRENIFHYLNDVEVYPDWHTTMLALKG
jgi:nucleoside 2-deoxyribosyltransferase